MLEIVSWFRTGESLTNSLEYSVRPTSSGGVNLLNLPSSGSKYAKPIKECFVVPKGSVILAVDLDSLEDKVLACLSKDKTKCSIFKDNLDSHCLNSYGYFKRHGKKY